VNTTWEVNMNSLNIIEKCQQLKLFAFAGSFEHQEGKPNYDKLDFNSRLAEMLDAQLQANSDKRIATLTKQAKLRYPQMFVEDIDYELYPRLKVTQVKQLARCEWINQKHHLLIIGPTGTGKTSLACVFANAAIRQHIPVLFYRLATLLLELVAAKNEGELVKFIRKINRAKLLILDDWGNALMNTEERHLLFELIESRDQYSSLLITSQYPVATWHDSFQDSTIADSVLDRIVHNAHVIDRTKKPSIRKLLSNAKGDK
jgi:DNA replication protein DnaC